MSYMYSTGYAPALPLSPVPLQHTQLFSTQQFSPTSQTGAVSSPTKSIFANPDPHGPLDKDIAEAEKRKAELDQELTKIKGEIQNASKTLDAVKESKKVIEELIENSKKAENDLKAATEVKEKFKVVSDQKEKNAAIKAELKKKQDEIQAITAKMP